MIVKGLSIGYPSRVVASDINIELEEGKLTCLIGENGIGKSTLLRTLAGFQKPLKGKIEIQKSQNLEPLSLSELSPKEISRLIAVVLTEKPNLQNTTVRELVAMGRMPYTGFFGRLSADDEKIVDDCMRTVGVEESRKVSTLSDGERQKVMIARALTQQTQYIFLDEPTAFLDYPSKVRTMEMLKTLAARHNKTILLSSHDVEIALDTADNIIMMERNKITIGKPKPRNHEKITSFTAHDLLIDC